MELRRLTAERDAVRRYVEDLWLPFNRELAAMRDDFALADDVDVVAEELDFRLDRLASEDYRLWVVVKESDGGPAAAEGDPSLADEHGGAAEDDGTGAEDGGGLADDDRSLADHPGEFVGFVATNLDEPSSVFDRPDRLVICDIYVRESARGTGLAEQLVERARERARELDCQQLRLDVDVANERALAFYEKFWFEPNRYSMVAPVDG